jgi:hypothetical protein
MQATAPRRKGRAFSIGFIFAILAAIVIFGYGVITGFRSNANTSQLWSWALLAAFFATPLLAGFVGTLRSGRIGAGTLAGLWDGFFVGIWGAAYILIAYFLTASNSASINTAIQQANAQLAQQGIHVTISQGAILISLIILGVILIILFLVIGALLGVIGALIGKIFAPRSNY